MIKRFNFVLIILCIIIINLACNNTDKKNMALISGGEFRFSDRSADTSVGVFYIGKHEVTYRNFINFINDINNKNNFNIKRLITDSVRCPFNCTSAIDMNNSKFYFNGNRIAENINCPVTMVTFLGAIKYCNWKSRLEGLELCYNITTVRLK